ncbi:MAG TPA: hypothetical protein PLL64_05795 [Rhodothermales bacterium]|nr:hypothetical protein [Bacteroidota bacterium]HRK73767.1 hypothetical protein [Rhodothermales bacterium]HRR10196.1 hypothetical protein [Rhodothermales bacterium]
MIKFIADKLWAFDAEWIPDPVAGRILYKLPAEMPDGEVMQHMWRQAAKSRSLIPTEADIALDSHNFLDYGVERPYLKTNICRLVSVSIVIRRKVGDGKAKLYLRSIPDNWSDLAAAKERNIIGKFLGGLENGMENYDERDTFNSKGFRKGVQLIGYNSMGADLSIFIQRALIHGLPFKKFNTRPMWAKDGVDYFDDKSAYNIDMQKLVGGFGRSNPSLNELAALSGIPGKMGTDGNDVALLWLDGKLDEIVKYNEYDALTTYLVFLRMAHFAGIFTPQEYEDEQQLVIDLIADLSKQERYTHLIAYQEEWSRLKALLQ